MKCQNCSTTQYFVFIRMGILLQLRFENSRLWIIIRILVAFNWTSNDVFVITLRKIKTYLSLYMYKLQKRPTNFSQFLPKNCYVNILTFFFLQFSPFTFCSLYTFPIISIAKINKLVETGRLGLKPFPSLNTLNCHFLKFCLLRLCSHFD